MRALINYVIVIGCALLFSPIGATVFYAARYRYLAATDPNFPNDFESFRSIPDLFIGGFLGFCTGWGVSAWALMKYGKW